MKKEEKSAIQKYEMDKLDDFINKKEVQNKALKNLVEKLNPPDKEKAFDTKKGEQF